MKLIDKIFFSADILFLGVVLNFCKCILLWQILFLEGGGGVGHFRLVILHLGKYGNPLLTLGLKFQLLPRTEKF